MQAIPTLLVFLVLLLKDVSNSSITWNLTGSTCEDTSPQKSLLLYITSFQIEMPSMSCVKTLDVRDYPQKSYLQDAVDSALFVFQMMLFAITHRWSALQSRSTHPLGRWVWHGKGSLV